MKFIISAITVLFATQLFAFHEPLSNQKGKLISYELKKSLSKEDLKAYWKSNKIPKFILPVSYGVDIYEVVYSAPWIGDSTMVQASGLYFVPRADKGEKLSVAIYHHGTQLEHARAELLKDAQQGISLGLAADGFITLMPDYYGIGKGEKRHIYQHAWSEAMSSIYMLYSVEELNEKLGVEHKPDIYLTGYSQGGHATMATHYYLQELNDPKFKVVAASPMSGAYDMSGAQAVVMYRPYPQPFYLPYLLVTYQEAYHYFPGDIYEVFKHPYDSLTHVYLDGEHRFWEFNRVLPSVPSDMLKPQYVEEFKNNPEFPIRKRIEQNNVYEWVPQAPTQLCYCSSDDQVAGDNSVVAYNWMKTHGAKDVRIEKISDIFYHNECALFAVVKTKFFFDNVRKGKIHRKKGPPLKNWLVKLYKRKKEKEIRKRGHEDPYEPEGMRAETQK